MASENQINIERRWTHADALLLAAHSGLIACTSLATAVTGTSPVRVGEPLQSQPMRGHLAQTSFEVLTQAVRRLAPTDVPVQGISVSTAARGQATTDVRIEGETGGYVGLPAAAAERQGISVSAFGGRRPATTLAKEDKSINAVPTSNPVLVKGGTGGVPPRGRPDEKG